MNNILVILLFFILPPYTNSEIDKVLKSFFKKKKCDPNCTFDSGNLTSQNIASFPKTCTTVCANLWIDEKCDLTENQLTDLFKNMKVLVGRLNVLNTNYTSGRFLAGLERIECDDSGIIQFGENFHLTEIGLLNLNSLSCPEFDLWSNHNLRVMNTPNWKILENPICKPKGPLFFILGSSPDFCLTTEEMHTFMNIVDYIDAKYCEPVLDEKLCKEPKEGCIGIFGDLEVVQNTDLEILKTVEIIYGSLIVNGTDIQHFEFFDNLMYIAQLEKDKPAIILENNPDLTNITFPKLKKIRAEVDKLVILTDNNKILSLHPRFCTDLRKSLKLDDEAISINGENCRGIRQSADQREWQEKQNKVAVYGQGYFLIIFIVFIYKMIH